MMSVKNDDGFKKRDSRAFQNIVQGHQIVRLPRKMTSESTPHFDSLSDAKRGPDNPKMMNLVRLPRRTYVAPKTGDTRARTHLRKRAHEHYFGRAFLQKRKIEKLFVLYQHQAFPITIRTP
jgi:hypothetical protein